MTAFRTILVYLDQDANSASKLPIATGLARAFAAHLVGIYLDDSLQITPSVAALLPRDIVADRLRSAAGAQHAAEHLYRQAAAAAALPDVEWRAPAGAPIDAAVAHARCSDLAIVGQPDLWQAEWSFAAQLATAVLLESGQPVLFVPHVGTPPSAGANILAAWDGGREASRALADAIPLLSRARQVTIACLDPAAATRGADPAGRDRLSAYLRGHGISARIECDNLGRGDIAVGDWLLSRAADLGADLIVMGGYGRPQWRERVLGGATRALLQTMTVPVFMAH